MRARLHGTPRGGAPVGRRRGAQARARPRRHRARARRRRPRGARRRCSRRACSRRARPDNLRWRIETGRELERLADELGDPRLQAVTHGALLDDTLEAGDIDASNREREAFERLAEQLGERYRPLARHGRQVARRAHRGPHRRVRGARAASVDARARRRRRVGVSRARRRSCSPCAASRAASTSCCRGAEAFAAQYPEVPAWRCGLAYVYAELGREGGCAPRARHAGRGRLRRAAARRLVAGGRRRCSARSPRSSSDPVHAEVLYEQLAPYAGHCVVITAACSGSAARVVGLLATDARALRRRRAPLRGRARLQRAHPLARCGSRTRSATSRRCCSRRDARRRRASGRARCSAEALAHRERARPARRRAQGRAARPRGHEAGAGPQDRQRWLRRALRRRPRRRGPRTCARRSR